MIVLCFTWIMFLDAMSNLYLVVKVYFILLVTTLVPSSGNWVYLGLVGVPPPLQQQQAEPGVELEDPDLAQASAICSAVAGLTDEQVKICTKHPHLIYSVANGARRGIQECQYQFRNERWNCTTSVQDESVFGHILETGSKETAFIYAITSAGVVHAITQGCSSGDLADCNCDNSDHGKNTPEGWKWSGCSDNIVYGIDFARKFVDAPEHVQLYMKDSESWRDRLQMNLHNNEAGRQIVSSLMKMHCRCHGISGSCELKTCWKMMSPFNEIGDILKKKYNHAVLLRAPNNGRKKRMKRNKGGIVNTDVKKSDLIHIRKSPNYCKYNPKKGILGTSGRKCNKTSHGPDSCDILCCGRGYKTQRLNTPLTQKRLIKVLYKLPKYYDTEALYKDTKVPKIEELYKIAAIVATIKSKNIILPTKHPTRINILPLPKVTKSKEKCFCKFVWCCYVKCRTCEKEQRIHYCK